MKQNEAAGERPGDGTDPVTTALERVADELEALISEIQGRGKAASR